MNGDDGPSGHANERQQPGRTPVHVEVVACGELPGSQGKPKRIRQPATRSRIVQPDMPARRGHRRFDGPTQIDEELRTAQDPIERAAHLDDVPADTIWRRAEHAPVDPDP